MVVIVVVNCHVDLSCGRRSDTHYSIISGEKQCFTDRTSVSQDRTSCFTGWDIFENRTLLI